MSELLRIEIVHALPEGYRCLELSLPAGSTVGDALSAASLAVLWPDLQWSEPALAVYGRIVGLDTRLNDFDRIELLRPLLIDPKEARRRRAAGGIKDL